MTDGVVGFKGRFQVSGVQLVQDQLCVRNARFSRKLPLALKLDSSMQKFGPNFYRTQVSLGSGLWVPASLSNYKSFG